MFNKLISKPSVHNQSLRDAKISNRAEPRQRLTLLIAALMVGSALMTGCQQSPESDKDILSTDEPVATEDSKPVVQSESASAFIKQQQPLYVEQVHRLQRRLQAEYESLQAADATESDQSLLGSNSSPVEANATESKTNNSTPNSTPINSDSLNSAPINPNNQAGNNSVANTANGGASINTTNTNGGAKTATNTVAKNDAVDKASTGSVNTITDETDINNSTEVGERDLTVLRSISSEPQKPILLTEKQIIKRYKQAIEALYQPASTPLTSEQTDTLINIAALIPQIFENEEIAARLNAKSPALARLIVQHQVWEQIEARQAEYMQQMKLKQQQEFESLMGKFNETIKDYDEQIAKYEETLQEFQ